MATLSYTTVARVVQQEPQLDPLKDHAIVSSAQLCTFAQDAEREMNGMLANRFTIPVSGSPPLLQTIATRITVGLTLSRIVYAQMPDQPLWVRNDLADARRLLESIAYGQMTLVDSSASVISTRNDLSELWSNTQGYAPTFSELDFEESLIDTDKTDDLENARDLDIIPDRLIR